MGNNSPNSKRIREILNKMGEEQKVMEIWTINNDKSYEIKFMAPIDKYESYLPIAQSMIDSFRILN